MNSDFSECSHGPGCKWEKKFHQKEKETKKLESKLDQNSSFYYEKFNSQARQIIEWENLVQHKRKKFQKKKQKILRLKQALIKKDEEIQDLATGLEISKGKISRLVKYRHQSVDQINELEAEIEQSKRSLQTPPVMRLKKERRSMQSTLELNFGIMPFEIPEIGERKQDEQEKLIESQSRLLQEERMKNKDLSYKLEMLNNDKLSLELAIESLQTHLSSTQTQAQEDKDKLKKVLTDKINLLKNENLDLKFKLKEYLDKESGINTSDIECFNLKDELSKLEISHRSKLFDLNTSANFCEGESRTHVHSSFQQVESQKIIQMLEHNLGNVMGENEKLKEEICKKKRYARELNKVLRENNAAFEDFRKKFSFDAVRDEVKKLNLEKVKIERLVQIRKMELLKLNEKNAFLKKKTGDGKKMYLEDVVERSNEESFRDNMATLINRKRLFPEDARRRRNINSWSYNVYIQDF